MKANRTLTFYKNSRITGVRGADLAKDMFSALEYSNEYFLSKRRSKQFSRRVTVTVTIGAPKNKRKLLA